LPRKSIAATASRIGGIDPVVSNRAPEISIWPDTSSALSGTPLPILPAATR